LEDKIRSAPNREEKLDVAAERAPCTDKRNTGESKDSFGYIIQSAKHLILDSIQ
jgi:hypothetical protein